MNDMNHTWIFFEEGKENEPQFEIEGRVSNVYDLAYEKYGPQVDDLFYKVKL